MGLVGKCLYPGGKGKGRSSLASQPPAKPKTSTEGAEVVLKTEWDVGGGGGLGSSNLLSPP